VKILFATFDSADQFLRRLDAGTGGAPTTLTVKTRARYGTKEAVILEIGFPGLPNRILARAISLGARPPAAAGAGSKRAKGRKGASASSDSDEQLFRFARGEEHKRDFLIAVAAGNATASWTRRHRRFPLRLPVRFVLDGESTPLRGDAETEDVGSGGVSIKTTRTLPDGARVTVVLEPGDGSDEIHFSGRVVWTRKTDGGNGVGVQFDRLAAEDRRRLRRLLREVKVSGETREAGDGEAGDGEAR
jgi:hypothetical protein